MSKMRLTFLSVAFVAVCATGADVLYQHHEEAERVRVLRMENRFTELNLRDVIDRSVGDGITPPPGHVPLDDRERAELKELSQRLAKQKVDGY